MRIGVDATSWANARGYGRFTREVLRAMVDLPAVVGGDHEFVFLVESQNAEAFDIVGERTRVRPVALHEVPTLAASSEGHRSPLDMLRLTRAVWRERFDVFFSPTVYTFFPLPPGLPACVCIHDAIAERFPELTLPSRRARLFWNAKVWLAVRQARLILTVSETARRDLVAELGVPEERIRVTIEAPAEAFRPSDDAGAVAAARERVGLPADARFLIYVGGFNPHKNVDLLVRAHAQLVADDPKLHLVLVGSLSEDVFHGDGRRIRATIAEVGTEALVHWRGFVPDEELSHLHTGATALVLPSMCEGFGLPAVEAAACGTPVVATRESPLPELLEGGGLFVEPGRLDVLVEALRRLAENEPERRAMGRRALERARRLTWPEAARLTFEAVREAGGAR